MTASERHKENVQNCPKPNDEQNEMLRLFEKLKKKSLVITLFTDIRVNRLEGHKKHTSNVNQVQP